ncbi:hypothetical protein ACHAWC_011291, partial [Mediolabrus comicus]
VLAYLLSSRPPRKPPRKRYSRKRLNPRWFGRRRLPYHLTLRCYRRKGNRPPRLPGAARRSNWRKLRLRLKSKRKERLHRKEIARVVNTELCVRDSCAAPLFLPKISEGVLNAFVATLDHLGLQPDDPLNWELDRVSTFKDMLNPATISYHTRRVCLLTTSWLCAGILSVVPLVFDSGASFDISPFRSDFLTYTPVSNTVVQGINAKSEIAGVGLVMYRFTTRSGRTIFRPSIAYHMPSADIRLLSPHVHMRMHGGTAELDGDRIVWKLPTPREGDNWVEGDVVDIPIDRRTNLPLVQDFLPSKGEKEQHSQRFIDDYAMFVSSDKEETSLENESALDCAELCVECSESPEATQDSFWSCLTVADPNNLNLSAPQKELLRYHWRYGISMKDIQILLKPRTLYDDDGIVISNEPPVLKSEYKSTATCEIPVCMTCKLANQRRRSTETSVIRALPDKVGSLSRGADAPGKLIHTDQMVVSTPGRLLKGYGREGPSGSIHGATSYSDAYSRYKSFQLQVSLNANETIDGKTTFENEIRDYAGVDVKHYRSDNGIFDSVAFRQDCKLKSQTQSFSAVGAKHQNAVAESDIRVIGSMARHYMVHASIHWPDTSAANARLWTFAVVQAVYVWNRLPKADLGYHTPIEVLSGLKSDHRELRRIKTWGCPTFVLHPTIQDGKKLPKFKKSRSRLAQHLGVSKEYSSMTGVCRNLRTNHASPQFHVVYDELFTVIRNDVTVEDAQLDEIFETLFEQVDNKEFYGELPEDSSVSSSNSAEPRVDEPDLSTASNLPPLSDDYLTEEEQADKQLSIAARRQRAKDQWDRDTAEFEELLRNERAPVTGRPVDNSQPRLLRQISFDSSSGEDSSSDEDDDASAAPGNAPEGAAPTVNEGAPSQAPPAPGVPPQVPPAPNLSAAPRRSERSRREYNRGTRGLTDGVSEGAYLSNPDYNRAYTSLVTGEHLDMNYVRAHPAQFGITSSKKRQRPFRLSRKRKQYKLRLAKRKLVEACLMMRCEELRIPTVEELMQSDLSRFVHLAAVDHGYEGTSSDLVVEWLHPLMLAAKANANKEDYPNWWQAMNGPFAEEYWKAAVLEIETLEEMDTWEIVDRDDKMTTLPSTWAMRCKRYPDGLIKKMKARLCARGDLQEAGVHYFDDSLYAPVRGVDLEEESDSAGFLGIDMKRIPADEEGGGKIVMTQKGLIDRVLLALGLDDNSTQKGTPCLRKPLVKDENGDPVDGSFSYSSVVGMLLYLANNTRPDLAYSVHCAARFSFCPKKSHEEALKRIGRYLKGTRDKGMVITPNLELTELKVDAYPDSDFGGLYGYEDIHDPVVTRSRTGFIINVADCPVLWKSQLQSETATSTMEAEINAMAACCRELFPILDMVQELSGAIGLSAKDGASMHIRLHEDNAGALILAQTIPPEFTPRSKHYAIKTNWFREQIVARGIKLLKCETKEMLGDLFTKCLPQPQFEYLRKKIMDW